MHQGRCGGEKAESDETGEMLAPNEGEEVVEINDQGDAEDVEPLRAKKEVHTPTASEVEDHRKTHFPPRSCGVVNVLKAWLLESTAAMLAKAASRSLALTSST